MPFRQRVNSHLIIAGPAGYMGTRRCRWGPSTCHRPQEETTMKQHPVHSQCGRSSRISVAANTGGRILRNRMLVSPKASPQATCSSQTEAPSSSGEVQGFDLMGHKGAQYSLWRFAEARGKETKPKVSTKLLASSLHKYQCHKT